MRKKKLILKQHKGHMENWQLDPDECFEVLCDAIDEDAIEVYKMMIADLDAIVIAETEAQEYLSRV